MKDLGGVKDGVIDVRVEIIELGSASTHEEKESRIYENTIEAISDRTILFLAEAIQ